MSTITKERVAQFIKNPLDNGLTRGEQMELARIALASLEAEERADPVAFINGAWTLVYYRPPKELGLKIGDKLYTAPPAKVSVPTFEEWCKRTEQKPVGWVHDAMKEAYDACRAAMLQGAENAESPTTMQAAPARYSSPKNAESTSGNSPVILDCSCRTCRPVTFNDSRFVVCPECGNKRCPRANDHRNACTGSNEPAQEGSAYPAAPQQEAE